MIIRYCLGLAAKSPSFYDDIRCNENNNTGFLILPSRRRLRDYKNYIRPTQGFNRDVVNELIKNIENYSEEERYVILLLDEMTKTKECITKQKPFLKPYTSVDDERFEWLTGTFLQYFTDWKNSIESRPGGPFSKTDKGRMFISWQTHEALIITIHSSIDLIKYLLNHQVKYVLTERFCQDPLEIILADKDPWVDTEITLI